MGLPVIQAVSIFREKNVLIYSCGKVEVACSSETVLIYQTAWCHIPQGHILKRYKLFMEEMQNFSASYDPEVYVGGI